MHWEKGFRRTGPARRGGLVALSLATLLAAGCGQRRVAPRNLILVTLDTVRADHLGGYGKPDAETPALDRLAREGIRFSNAFSTVPLTLPSHATILSGLTPPHHGLRNNGGGAFPVDRPTLATRLSSAGYRTGAFVGAFVLDHRFGLDRGFDTYDDEIDRDPAAGAGLEAERPGSIVVDRALAWLENKARPGEPPFFAWVHLYDAHAPYAPPEPYASRHRDSPYDGEIASVDAQVARLIGFLETRGLAATTLVAVAADHGEALGEHGELTHGLLLYDPTLRVPLILRGAGLPAGRVVDTPVSLADLAPTLAGLLATPLVPPKGSATRAGASLDGRDLSDAVRRGTETRPADLYAETEYPRIFGWSGLSSVRRRGLKYVAGPKAELYDWVSDPKESANRLGNGQRRSDLDRTLAALRGGGATPAPAVAPSAEAAAKLASLGYIGGRIPPGAEGRPLPDPKDMAPFFRRFETANWELEAGRAAAAARALEPLLAADPGNPVFRGLLAKALRRQGDLPRAIALYREAVERAPEDPETRYNLAVTLQEAGRSAEALTALAEAIRRDPSRPEAHNALAISLVQAGRPVEALAELDRAIEIDPRDARAHGNRGNVLRGLSRFEEAEAAYRRAVALSPRYAEAWNGLGALEVARGRPRASIAFFRQALELAPAYKEVKLNLGIAFETLGDAPAALAAYGEFVRDAEGDPEFTRQTLVARQLIARLGPTRARAAASKPERR